MTFLKYIIVVLLPNVRNVRTLRLIIRKNPIICFPISVTYMAEQVDA